MLLTKMWFVTQFRKIKIDMIFQSCLFISITKQNRNLLTPLFLGKKYKNEKMKEFFFSITISEIILNVVYAAKWSGLLVVNVEAGA